MKKVGVGLIVVVSIGAGLFWGVLFGKTRSVPGEPSRFDPVGQLADIASFACGGCKLIELSARGVRPDGTVDLTADYEPSVQYLFERPGTSGADGPIGSGSAKGEHVAVAVSRPGMAGSHNVRGQPTNFYNFGMVREAFEVQSSGKSRAVEDPCAFGQLWQSALSEGAPDNAVAFIEYGYDGYEFSIQGTKHRFEFDLECALKAR